MIMMVKKKSSTYVQVSVCVYVYVRAHTLYFPSHYQQFTQ